VLSRNASATNEQCKYGTFSFLGTDTLVGRAFNDYGEYGEDEISMFRQILRPGDVAWMWARTSVR